MEKEHIVLRYAQKLQELDDANPDVGMGPSFSSLIEQACTELNINIDQAALTKQWHNDYVRQLTLSGRYGRIK